LPEGFVDLVTDHSQNIEKEILLAVGADKINMKRRKQGGTN
jgi:hypothetical protein